MKILLKTLSIFVSYTIISNTSYALDAERLKELANNYIQFIISIGKGEEFASKMPAIFHPTCRKIENGTEILNTFEGHKAQLQKAFEHVGYWSAETLKILASPKDNASTIHFKWHSNKIEPHTTMAILSFDENGLITIIDEVYNKYQSNTLVIIE